MTSLVKHIAIILTAMLFSLAADWNSAAAQNLQDEKEILIPARLPLNITPLNSEKEQPFAGKVGFIGSPAVDQPCTVRVEMTCMVSLDSTQTFRLGRLYPYLIDIMPDSAIWEGPLDSGDVFQTSFSFTPHEVGSYQFVFSRRLSGGLQNLASLVLAINEDGKTIYAGDETGSGITLIPPHPRRDADTITLSFPLRAETCDPRQERHFTATFDFHPAPVLKETTWVDFDLECHFDLYRDVQFILDHSGNINPSELPESWGNRAGPVEGYRHYRGTFSLVPLVSGIVYLNFKIVGARPMVKQSSRLTTEFPMYFVLGDDGALRFIGYNNPWQRFTDRADPMLGGVEDLMDITRRDYRLRHVQSLPDFIGDEMSAARDSLLDSVKEK